jgi:CelD/BcsL family acetyltransferase involved in cellulose biosynthesis
MIRVGAAALTTDRFEEYEALSRSVKYGVNLHPLWFATYIHAFNYENKHLILEARDGESGTLHGLLPLVRKESTETRFLTHHRLVPAGYGPTDFFGFPATPGREAEVAEATAEWFASQRTSWDHLMMDLLPQGQGAWELFAEQLARVGFKVDVMSDRNYLTLDCGSPYDAYLSRLGSAKLKDLRYYRNRLLKRGSKLEVVHLDHGLASYFDAFVQLYTSRRSSKNQSDPYTRVVPLRQFVGAIIPQYEKRGWITLSLLKLDEIIVAYCYCLMYARIMYYYMPTFRDEYKDCAPGKLLLMELIRRAFEMPEIVQFNFMRSEYTYKHWFEPEVAPYFKIKVDNHRSPRTHALRLVDRLRSLRSGKAEAK